jgi:hypothetical protein
MEPAVVEALGRPHVGIDGSVTHVSLGRGVLRPGSARPEGRAIRSRTGHRWLRSIPLKTPWPLASPDHQTHVDASCCRMTTDRSRLTEGGPTSAQAANGPTPATLHHNPVPPPDRCRSCASTDLSPLNHPAPRPTTDPLMIGTYDRPGDGKHPLVIAAPNAPFRATEPANCGGSTHLLGGS